VKHALPWLAWWLLLFWLWLLLAGDWNLTEIVAAAGAAAAAATIGEIARSRARVAGSFSPQWLTMLAAVPVMIVVDFGIVAWALVRSALRREIVRGEFVRRPFHRDDPGLRAWVGYVAAFTPNAYAVGFDAQRETALVHDLVRNRRSERPV
jgi:multisubunit Na+/H+ antiporter MnhE subunit